MEIVHIVNWCTWLTHTLCKGLIWNYKKLFSTALTFIWDPGSASMKLRMYQVIFFDWYRILFLNLEICTISIFNFGWWYTLIHLFKWIFLLKKTVFLSVCLSACLPACLPVCLSVCLSVCRFRPKLVVFGLYLQFEFTDDYEMMHKNWSSIEEVPYCLSRLSVKFQGHWAKKNINFDPKLGFFRL